MINNFDNWNKLNKLRNIDFDSGQFEANGKTHYLENKLAVGRFCEFQILQRELWTGMSVQDFFKVFMDIEKLLNQLRFNDIAISVNQVKAHMAKVKEKEPVMFKICTLFINTEEEDRNKWDNDLVVKKMHDWKESGIDSHDFFHIALTLVPGFVEQFNMFIQSISGSLEVGKVLLDNA